MTLKLLDSWLARIIGMLTVVGLIYAGIHFVVRAELSELNTKMEISNTNIAQLRDNISRIDGDIKKTNDRIDSVLSQALDKLVGAK